MRKLLLVFLIACSACGATPTRITDVTVTPEPKLFYLCDVSTQKTVNLVRGYGTPEPVNIMSPDYRPGGKRWEYTDERRNVAFWDGPITIAPARCPGDGKIGPISS